MPQLLMIKVLTHPQYPNNPLYTRLHFPTTSGHEWLISSPTDQGSPALRSRLSMASSKAGSGAGRLVKIGSALGSPPPCDATYLSPTRCHFLLITWLLHPRISYFPWGLLCCLEGTIAPQYLVCWLCLIKITLVRQDIAGNGSHPRVC